MVLENHRKESQDGTYDMHRRSYGTDVNNATKQTIEIRQSMLFNCIYLTNFLIREMSQPNASNFIDDIE